MKQMYMFQVTVKGRSAHTQPPIEHHPAALTEATIVLKSLEQSDIMKGHRTRLLPGAVPPRSLIQGRREVG
ncbi:protein of unknown function [Kyrpidia spormannii]|uniref:Uncharacterized protein n=1 Tax=Kyrpidia spormannii TaxID=2055160 RepID=A0ACA8ZDX7_9BACL|nr:protein of unknown function [Kyrpidia spormannii]